MTETENNAVSAANQVASNESAANQVASNESAASQVASNEVESAVEEFFDKLNEDSEVVAEMASVTEAVNPTKGFRVYEKVSKYKDENGVNKSFYSGTRSDGSSVIVVFTGTLRDKVKAFGKAFFISSIRGQMKSKEIDKDGKHFINYKYYVSECDVSPIPSEDLPY